MPPAEGEPRRGVPSFEPPSSPGIACVSQANRKEIAMSSGFLESWRGTVEIDGYEVAKLRKMRGLSVAQRAEKTTIGKVPVGKSTIEKWEAAGVVNADVENVRAVADALAIQSEE